MFAIADLIVFGVQAAVKLARTGRTIYVEETIRSDVVMPLPKTLTSPFVAASNYASELSRGSERDQQIFREFFEDDLNAGNEDELVQTYMAFVQKGEVPAARSVLERERAGVAILGQWDEGKSLSPSPLQRVAGTLVNIAVDYFVQVPGAINEESRYGKTLKAFLRGIEDVKFDEARWDSIVIALFTAGVEALGENPELFSDDDDENALVRTIVTGVAEDLKTRMQTLQGPDVFKAEARLKRFGSIVLRSLLTGSTRSLVANPTVLGVNDSAQKALVTNVGGALLDLVLEGDKTLGEGLQALASTGGLEKLVHAALKTAAEHPDIFRTGNAKLKGWLTGVVNDLYQVYPHPNDLFNADLFGNIAYVMLERGRQELDALLVKKLGGGKGALMKEVVEGVFGVLVEKPAAGKPARWKFGLTQADLVGVFEDVALALAAHPEWLLEKPAHRKIAAEAIPVLVEVVMGLGKGNQPNLFKGLLRSGRLEPVLAAVLASGILDKLRTPAGKLLDANKLAASINKILVVVTRNGVTGLDRIFEPGQLRDLLTAIASSNAVDAFFPEHTAEAPKIIKALVARLDAIRAGKVVPVPEIIKELNAAA